jgi:hypothetical protein
LFIYVVNDIFNANDKLLNTTNKFIYNILWLKVVLVLILIHPAPFTIPTIGIREGPSRTVYPLEGRSWKALRMECQSLMVRTMIYGEKG